MANKFTYQVLRDTTTDAVIKLTGTFDGASGQEANNVRIQANTLANALATNGYLVANNQGGSANTPLSYYDLQLTGIKGIVNMPTSNTSGGMGAVEIFWNGGGATAAAQYANSATIFHLSSSSDYGNGEQLPSIPNNANNSPLGDIGVYTNGAQANCSYTLIVSLRKNNAMYQRGQINDPAAFNYGQYSLKP